MDLTTLPFKQLPKAICWAIKCSEQRNSINKQLETFVIILGSIFLGQSLFGSTEVFNALIDTNYLSLIRTAKSSGKTPWLSPIKVILLI